jgi:VIT1/CCC1 family predicted Fe2+/Mn2+ transporter
MARTHHRKKHKEHLRQFKHSHDTVASKTKGKAIYVFLIIGAIVGLAIGYFASTGATGWMAIGLVAGGIAGYLIGRSIDGSK